MPRLLPRFLLAGLVAPALLAGPDLRLWYRQPATAWVEALPVGNGPLGAMVFGGVAEERIAFNEDTIWTGQPRAYHREGAVAVLPELRRLLAAGQQQEASTSTRPSSRPATPSAASPTPARPSPATRIASSSRGWSPNGPAP